MKVKFNTLMNITTHFEITQLSVAVSNLRCFYDIEKNTSSSCNLQILQMSDNTLTYLYCFVVNGKLI